MRKISLIGWESTCQPNDRGGLGLQRMEKMNEVMLMKLGWGLLTQPDSLWVQVLKTKYKLDLTEIPENITRSTRSFCGDKLVRHGRGYC